MEIQRPSPPTRPSGDRIAAGQSSLVSTQTRTVPAQSSSSTSVPSFAAFRAKTSSVPGQAASLKRKPLPLNSALSSPNISPADPSSDADERLIPPQSLSLAKDQPTQDALDRSDDSSISNYSGNGPLRLVADC
jgi:hypothetical protein